MKKIVKRPIYLNKLIKNKDKDTIKIISGLRRVGKSSLLKMYKSYLLESGINDDNIIDINLESLENRKLLDCNLFYEYVKSKIPKIGKTYLLFDEIQEVKNWEKAIESFRIEFDVDIYITGSNAYLLSNELSTLIAGRYIEIKMLPLSFKEFLDFYSFNNNLSIDEKFKIYLRYGGLPILAEYSDNPDLIRDVLDGIYSTVILKDILQKNKTINQSTLSKISMFLSSNIGSITSPNNIGNILSRNKDLGSEKNNIASKTVEKYIEMLKMAYFIYPVNRYDIKGKELLKSLYKIYIVDIGFRNLLLGYQNTDIGHILENIVFLELIRRGYRVYIGKIGDYEVDFIAEKLDEKVYIQVFESILSDNVKNRELRSLNLIKDNFKKIILTLDRNPVSSYDGIENINLIDWLCDC